MVQMTAADQAVVKALPGNTICCDCGMKSPQWASVSFGNVFCLECSGVHRSLGVHISFVRSIAMDSWTDKQLALMKNGGNNKCNDYLKKHGIDARTPIKQKYESSAAQLYKEVLKARVEGRPEPTELPKPAPKPASSFGSTGSLGASGGGGGDPNGMERLAGETDQQYIARQTRLREEARARMASKFGGSGMGGVGSGGGGGGRMQGIGSDPSYNPNGGYGGGGDLGVDSLVSGFGSFATSMKNTVSSTISSTLTEDNLRAVKSTGASFWGSLTAGVSTVATTLTKPQEDDGLAQLQREVASHKPTQSKYTGFGGGQTGFSDNPSRPSVSAPAPTPSQGMMQLPNSGGGGGTLQEAPGLPHEDRNGIERLTGESDEQYIMRQTRLRDEARARMAAKFGGGGMSSASSSSAPAVPRTAPSSGNSPFTAAPAAAAAPGYQSAPSSGNRPTKISTPAKPMNSDDFFSTFGT
uniref:Arf-GAP domain-containing protein n=1 Tax=Amphora coffeiformis TaxID=265554 RepID=A0A7S3P2L1_9STRA|mmetsp:Transcript_3320/g.6342  ORF Transcript_3320/g.6342 Transcript_3320/m.6342 type:complete len:468 (-) Transcript_3320:43-1446(-)